MIEKIILKVGEKTIELTEDEARQVWADLNPRFSQPTYIPYYPPAIPYPSYPYWISNGTATISSGSTVPTSSTATYAEVPFTYTS
jgi:hypothetical protein